MSAIPRRLLAGLILLGAGSFANSARSAGTSGLPTLAESATQAVDQALAGKTPGPDSQNLYRTTKASVSDMVSNVFVRNANLWVGPKVDLTAISAYSTKDDAYGTKFAVTAISPLHCLGAAHATLKPGTQLNFVGVDNRTATRTVVSAVTVAGDVRVYLLDSELPRTITPMKILPADWAKYLRLGDDYDTPPIPVLFVNQANRLYCAEAVRIADGPVPMVFYHLPSTDARRAFNTQIISGDSSFPEMLLIHGEPVILSCWFTGGFGAGPLEASQFNGIDAAMHKLSTAAGLTSDYRLSTPYLKDFWRAP